MDIPEQSLTKRQRRELKRQSQAQDQAKQAQRKKLTTWLMVIGSVIVVGGLIYWAVAAGNNSQPDITLAVNPVLGSEQATVVITEFSDFSCPACAAVAPTIRQLATEYGDSIKIVFNNFNLGHRWSEESLEAGECAFQQNKFWEYGDLVFAQQDEWVNADEAVDKLKSYAQEVGLNTDQFNGCLDSGTMKEEVDEDMVAARRKKITATPTIFINDQKMVGVQSLTEYKKIIDAELDTSP